MKLSEIKAGDVLIADGGFTCLHEGERCEVKADEKGELYVACGGSDDGAPEDAPFNWAAGQPRAERHALDGQIDHDDPDKIVGFMRAA
jgi:hypothetical protein